MPSIRRAAEHDLEPLGAFDEIARGDGGARRSFIRLSIDAGRCFVVVADGRAVAYGVLGHSFFGQGSVEMLYVDARHRRSSYGTMLMRHMESLCRTDKLFTSTNLSNLPMQSLLAKLGYTLSGVVHGLDEGDPELVYLKRLSRSASS